MAVIGGWRLGIVPVGRRPSCYSRRRCGIGSIGGGWRPDRRFLHLPNSRSPIPVPTAMHERLTHFREILRYVPRFRDRVFVIAIDGAVVEDDNFPNLLLDIALLRSLNIGVALVHGAAHQINRLAEQLGQTPSNIDGTGVTDAVTLQVALTAANRVT